MSGDLLVQIAVIAGWAAVIADALAIAATVTIIAIMAFRCRE